MTRSFATAPSSSSVSNAEVSKFSNLSETWWDPQHNPLIAMNALRVQYIVQQVQERLLSASKAQNQHVPLQQIRALDVGCGGGLLSQSLARLGANVTAIDPSHELIEQAQQHAQLLQRATRHPGTTIPIEFRGGVSVEELAAVTGEDNDNKYDLVCLLEVLEHVTDVDSVLTSIGALLKPNALFVCSTLNRTYQSHALAIVGAEYAMGYLPVGTHDWHQFRSPEEVAALVQTNIGLQEQNVSGMVVTTLPPMGVGGVRVGSWDWKLDPDDTNVNWIGTYQKPMVPSSA